MQVHSVCDWSWAASCEMCLNALLLYLFYLIFSLINLVFKFRNISQVSHLIYAIEMSLAFESSIGSFTLNDQVARARHSRSQNSPPFYLGTTWNKKQKKIERNIYINIHIRLSDGCVHMTKLHASLWTMSARAHLHNLRSVLMLRTQTKLLFKTHEKNVKLIYTHVPISAPHTNTP